MNRLEFTSMNSFDALAYAMSGKPIPPHGSFIARAYDDGLLHFEPRAAERAFPITLHHLRTHPDAYTNGDEVQAVRYSDCEEFITRSKCKRTTIKTEEVNA